MHQLDLAAIYVVEGGKRYMYSRMFQPDKTVNYYPPADKNQMYENLYVDEIMFLPIDLEVFKTDRSSTFTGIRYFITAAGHQTITLGPDPLKLGVTTVQLSVDIHRFTYTIKNKADVFIDRTFDALYPTRLVNIEEKSDKVGEKIQETIRKIVMQYNGWYANKEV